MINIKTGPLIKKYAAIYLHRLDYDMDEAERDVCNWINDYVNTPEGLDKEPTEKERLDAIKAYIQWRVEDSVTGRIKKRLKEAKCLQQVSAQPAEQK